MRLTYTSDKIYYIGDNAYIAACKLRETALELLREADRLEHCAIENWFITEKRKCSSTDSSASSSA